jgi:hypothetical protein
MAETRGDGGRAVVMEGRKLIRKVGRTMEVKSSVSAIDERGDLDDNEERCLRGELGASPSSHLW